MKRRFPLWWDSWWEGWGLRLFNMNRKSVVYAYTKGRTSAPHTSVLTRTRISRDNRISFLLPSDANCSDPHEHSGMLLILWHSTMRRINTIHSSTEHRALTEKDQLFGIMSLCRRLTACQQRWEGLTEPAEEECVGWGGITAFPLPPRQQQQTKRMHEYLLVISKPHETHVKNLLKFYSCGKWNLFNTQKWETGAMRWDCLGHQATESCSVKGRVQHVR